MIITKQKSYKEMKSKLKKSDKIGIVSCNSCVKICKTGGDGVMKELASKLKKDRYNIVDVDLIGTPCKLAQLEKSMFHGNVSIVLACDAGVYNLKKILPKNHKVIGVLNTIGLGAVDRNDKAYLVKSFE